MKKKHAFLSCVLTLMLVFGLLPATLANSPEPAYAATQYKITLNPDNQADLFGRLNKLSPDTSRSASAGDVVSFYAVLGSCNIEGVQYSTDGGTTWDNLDVWTKSAVKLPSGDIPSCNTYQLSMPASDIVVRLLSTPYNTITSNICEHGSVVTSATAAAPGTSINVTPVPDTGYKTASITVTTNAGESIVCAADGSFTMPSGTDVVVSATFEPFESSVSDVTIANASEFASWAQQVNEGNGFSGKIVRLANSIDVSTVNISAIGSDEHPFCGIFDGAGFTISGVKFALQCEEDSLSNKYYGALFGCVGKGGQVYDLTVEGTSSLSWISNAQGASAGGYGAYLAGVVGCVKQGAVVDSCVSRVVIDTTHDSTRSIVVGGIAACCEGVIRNCENRASITHVASGTYKDQSYAAGIVGYIGTLGSQIAPLGVRIEECLNTGVVSGYCSAGGIVAGMVADSNTVISQCANKAKVCAVNATSGRAFAAGVVACLETGASVESCYNTGNISAIETTAAATRYDLCPVVAGVAGLKGLTETKTTLWPQVTSCYSTGKLSRTGEFANDEYFIGDVCPDKVKYGSNYAQFTEGEPEVVKTTCFDSSDTFSAADLGSNWRDDVNLEGSPLLTWEPADATNAKLPIPATSVTLSNTSLTLEQYDVATLSATVEPEDTTDALVWSSSDASVATVTDRGVVSAVSAGTCTITATAGNVSATCEVSVMACKDTLLHGGETLQQGGTYKLAGDAKGTITIDTEDAVTIRGMGADKNRKYQNSIYFDCTRQTSKLTLCDMYLSNTGNTNLVNFAGQGNELSIEGTCVLDYSESGYNSGGDALIHVPQDASLTVKGSGALYAYKSSAGALFGGDGKELNGNITFALTGSMFAKGTKQGAVIGSGAESASVESAPGAITFESGTYNLISNSRGAVIGGAAGSNGASSGTKVYVHGGSVNVNCDYSGSAVGGGGYADGNDSSGGTVYITGGSFRTYVDKNAAENITGKYYKGLPLVEGINNVAVTAERKNETGEDVFLCVVDTYGIEPAADGTYTVAVDGKPFFSGKLHEYAFLNEAVDRADGSGGKVDTSVSYTPENWVANEDSCLYLYLTGTSHTIEVNGQTIEVAYNASSLGTAAETNGGSFTVPYARGDVNNNGSLNIVDAQITYDLVAGVYANEQGDYATFPLPEGWNLATLLLAADANESGTLEAADAFAIQYAVLHNGVFANKG